MTGSDFWRGMKGRGSQTPVTSQPASPSTPALLPKPVASSALDEEMEKLLGELRNAIKAAGMEREDPLMPLVTAFAKSIRFMAERTNTSDRVLSAACEQIKTSLVDARRTADAEAERFSASILATEANFIQRISGSIAASADKALTRRVHVYARNTALWAAAVLFGTALTFGLGGYFYGGNVARADIHETEIGLQAAFSNNPRDAQAWMLLMQWNNLTEAWRSCRKPQEAILENGRHACAMPLWIEKPQAAQLEQGQ